MSDKADVIMNAKTPFVTTHDAHNANRTHGYSCSQAIVSLVTQAIVSLVTQAIVSLVTQAIVHLVTQVIVPLVTLLSTLLSRSVSR